MKITISGLNSSITLCNCFLYEIDNDCADILAKHPHFIISISSTKSILSSFPSLKAITFCSQLSFKDNTTSLAICSVPPEKGK